jgi:5-methylcytosine-specific restriction protein A
MTSPWGNKRASRSVSGYAWQRIRQAVIERDGGVCTLRLPGCTVTATTADHIIGVAQGGSDNPSNLRASCAHCNEARRKQQAAQARAQRPSRLREPEKHPGLL